MYISKFGDWARAGVMLQAISVNLLPLFKAQIDEDGQLVREKLQGHIDAQDLPWVPLSQRTIELKGSDTIYVETGYLRDNLDVRRVKSVANGTTLFIGASAWKRNPEGIKFSDLMIWLEYGTSHAPARPLIRPTWEEVKPLLEKNWEELLKNIIETGGK